MKPTEGVGEVRGELPDDEGDGQRADREDLGAAEGAPRRLHGRAQGSQGQDLQPQEGEKCQLLASALAPVKSEKHSIANIAMVLSSIKLQFFRQNKYRHDQ